MNQIINGIKEGYWEEYYSNGKLQCTGFTNDNAQVGYWKFYFENGHIFSEGVFDDNGNPIGTWYEYYDYKPSQISSEQKNG